MSNLGDAQYEEHRGFQHHEIREERRMTQQSWPITGYCPAMGPYHYCIRCGDNGNGNRCPYQASSSSASQASSPSARAIQAYPAGISALQTQAYLAQQAALQGASLTNYLWGTANPALEDAGLSVGEKIGYRIWRIFLDGLLYSWSADFIWTPGEIEEAKNIEDYNSYGFWAFKDKKRALQKFIDHPHGVALGSIYLWGTVIEHTDGWRGQFAKIRSIDFVRE